MKKILDSKYFLWAVRLILGGIFFYAGAVKIIDPLSFADNINQYELLQDSLINLVALTLPVFECLVALLLVTGRFDRIASSAVIAMCLVFAVALISAIARGLVIDCGCFETSEPDKWSAWWALLRDLCFLAGAAWLYFHALKASAANEAEESVAT